MGQQLAALRAKLRSREEAREEDAAGAAAAERAAAGMERLEGTLVKLTGMLKQREAEVKSLQMTVHRECAERMRLLDEIDALRGGGVAAAGVGGDGGHGH